MIARILLLVSLCAATSPSLVAQETPASTKPTTAPAKTWLDDVPVMRIGGTRAFQFRMDIDVGAEQIVAYVSWAPPDKSCVIFCDRVDGLPVLVANGGHVWLFDPIGGQIVRTGGAAEVMARLTGYSVQTSWGVRTVFPDDASRITTDVDFAGVLKGLAAPAAPKLSADAKRRIATATNKQVEVTLAAGAANPPLPISFDFKSSNTTPGIALRFDSIVFDAPPPAWHRTLNEAALAKHISVVDMDNSDALPPKAQAKLVKFKSVMNGRALFVLRSAMRDDELLANIEKNSTLRLDFDEVRANEKKLSGTWVKALAEQGIAMPKPAARPATKPAAPKKP